MKIVRCVCFLSVVPLLLCLRSLAGDWPPISQEDLSMTSIKEQPGAPALVLQPEEIDDDLNNVHSVYARIKILTDAGREYENVELPYSRRGFSIAGISGRTVSSDGSIVPFEGKSFNNAIEKGC